MPKIMREVVRQMDAYGRTDLWDYLIAYNAARTVIDGLPPPIGRDYRGAKLTAIALAADMIESGYSQGNADG